MQGAKAKKTAAKGQNGIRNTLTLKFRKAATSPSGAGAADGDRHDLALNGRHASEPDEEEEAKRKDKKRISGDVDFEF